MVEFLPWEDVFFSLSLSPSPVTAEYSTIPNNSGKIMKDEYKCLEDLQNDLVEYQDETQEVFVSGKQTHRLKIDNAPRGTTKDDFEVIKKKKIWIQICAQSLQVR